VTKAGRPLRALRRRTGTSGFTGLAVALGVIFLVMALTTYIALTSGPPTTYTPLPSTTSTSPASSSSSTASSSASSTSGSLVAVNVMIPKGSGTPNGAPGYSPDKITVVMGVNNTVTWTNDDTVAHTVNSVAGNGSIISGNLAPGATYTYTFPAPGTYDYFCEYHAWMSGTVIVKSG
jgi:plastocyanin